MLNRSGHAHPAHWHQHHRQQHSHYLLETSWVHPKRNQHWTRTLRVLALKPNQPRVHNLSQVRKRTIRLHIASIQLNKFRLRVILRHPVHLSSHPVLRITLDLPPMQNSVNKSEQEPHINSQHYHDYKSDTQLKLYREGVYSVDENSRGRKWVYPAAGTVQLLGYVYDTGCGVAVQLLKCCWGGVRDCGCAVQCCSGG